MVDSLASEEETNSDKPMVKTDFFVSIMKEQCKQDPAAVMGITQEVLKLHKEKNPHIDQYWLRSDQVRKSSQFQFVSLCTSHSCKVNSKTTSYMNSMLMLIFFRLLATKVAN